MFEHTTCANLEQKLILLLLNDYWKYLTKQLKDSNILEDKDKVDLFIKNKFYDNFLVEQNEYINSNVINK